MQKKKKKSFSLLYEHTLLHGFVEYAILNLRPDHSEQRTVAMDTVQTINSGGPLLIESIYKNNVSSFATPSLAKKFINR